jgi:hypothetical protein
MSDQWLPFQCSTEALAASVTAKQFVVVVHETLTRSAFERGWVMIDQLPPPFQCSTRLWWSAGLPVKPVAKQLVVVGQDTPSRKAKSPRLGVPVMIDQPPRPFQCSIKGLPESPMAKQLVLLGHDTLDNIAYIEPGGLRVVMTDQ